VSSTNHQLLIVQFNLISCYSFVGSDIFLSYLFSNILGVCLCLFSTTHWSLLRLIVRSGLDVPAFATRRLHACSTQRRKVELWARNVREFCLNADLHVTFRDPLHAVKLRHGTDGFTSPPKEGVLRIFSP